MAKAPAFQFYVKDWLADTQLRLVSTTTKGIWIDLLCYMWDAPTRGVITGKREMIAKMVGASDDEFEVFIQEALQYKFCNVAVTRTVTGNGLVTVENRRMTRETKAKTSAALRQKRFRERHKK